MFDVLVYISFLLGMLFFTKILFLTTERNVKKSIQDEFAIDEIIEEANNILKARDSLQKSIKDPNRFVEINKYLKTNDIISHYATLDVGCFDLQPKPLKPFNSNASKHGLDEQKFFEELKFASDKFKELILRTNNNAKRLYEIKHPIKSKLYYFYMKIRSVWFRFVVFLLQQLLKVLDKTTDGRKLENTAKLQKHLDENERKAIIPIIPLQDCLELAH